MKNSIVVVSMLFKECQTFTPFRSYQRNVFPFDFSIVILGVIFDTFYTSFGYKNWNIETNTSKFCIEVHFNGLFWMKNFDLEFLSILGDFDQFRPKIASFTKIGFKENH